MNNTEMIQVLRLFSAAWPGRELTDDTIDLWMEKLGHLEAADAFDVAHLLIDEVPHFPSIATFRDRYKELLQNRKLDAGFKALPAPAFDAEAAKENVRKLRELVAAAPTVRRLPPEPAEHDRIRRPAPPLCSEDDHSKCGAGPVRNFLESA